MHFEHVFVTLLVALSSRHQETTEQSLPRAINYCEFKTVKLATTIIIIVLLTIPCIGQPDRTITKEQALEDLKIFQTSLEEIHPNIYRYTPTTDFDKEYRHIRGQVGETITIKQFYNLLAPVITMVRCGHTFGIASVVDDKKGLFPLDVKILNSKMFVLKNLSTNTELSVGSELLTINGMSMTDVINVLRKRQSADGYGVNFKDRIIEKDFRWKYAGFISQPDSFEIEYTDYKTTERRRVTIAALSNDLIAQRLRQLNLADVNPLGFSIDAENNVAVLTLGSFMAKSIRKQSGQDLRKTIKRSFKQLDDSKVDNLIIDLRGNTGGKAFATPLLFSYLADNDFKVSEKILFRHGYKFSHPEYLNRNKFNDWINKKFDKKINDSTYEWTLHKITKKTFKVKQNPYNGKVYILTNGMTASAGAEFASILRAHKKGIFIGEETGGDYNGVNGFDRTYVSLPNSGVGILIAGWRSIMAWEVNKNIGHGVLPDYEVSPSLEDLLSGQDTQMKFTYELILKSK
jgi:C-terminal processing protease CtpA/Prc